jgi:hypothetical protein
MVGLAAICWAMWKSCNSISFEKKRFRSPTEIIFLASSFLKYWAGLQKEEEKITLEEGGEAMKNAALLHRRQEQDQGEPRTGSVLL